MVRPERGREEPGGTLPHQEESRGASAPSGVLQTQEVLALIDRRIEYQTALREAVLIKGPHQQRIEELRDLRKLIVEMA